MRKKKSVSRKMMILVVVIFLVTFCTKIEVYLEIYEA